MLIPLVAAYSGVAGPGLFAVGALFVVGIIGVAYLFQRNK